MESVVDGTVVVMLRYRLDPCGGHPRESESWELRLRKARQTGHCNNHVRLKAPLDFSSLVLSLELVQTGTCENCLGGTGRVGGLKAVPRLDGPAAPQVHGSRFGWL